MSAAASEGGTHRGPMKRLTTSTQCPEAAMARKPKFRARLLLLLALVGCAQQDGPQTPTASTTAPITTTQPLLLSSVTRVGSASGALGSRRAADAVFASSTHQQENAHNVEEGAPVLSGRVALSSGSVCGEPFEVRLTSTGVRRGAPAITVLFSDGSGTFRLWPPPGEYSLAVRTVRSSSRPTRVRVQPGANPTPVKVVLR